MSETWILLRGLTREHGHWGRFVHELRAVLPPASVVITPDLPGNGLLHQEESPTSVVAMMARCREILAEQGHTPPYNVVAMSLGAMVTVAWAAQHPHELTRCVLINTSLRPFSPFWQRLHPRHYPLILKLLCAGADAQAWEAAIMRMTTRHPPEAETTLQHWMHLRDRHPVSVRNGLRQLWAASSYRAARHAPSVPMLLLNSRGDRLVDPRCSSALARHWHLPLITHPTAGHDLPLDGAPWVARQIAWWLGGSPAQAP